MSALIGVGGDLIGGLFGSSSAKAQNKAAEEMSQKQMDFQERMSNTAHQREVADLRAAGLNPILSAHGGASSPGGSMAPVVNPAEPLRDSLKHSAQRVQDAVLNRASIATMQSQQELNRANAAKSAAETDVIRGGTVSIPGFYRGPAVRAAASAKHLLHNVTGAHSKSMMQSRRNNRRRQLQGRDADIKFV